MAWNDLTDEEKKKRLYVLNNNLLLQYRQNTNSADSGSGGQSAPAPLQAESTAFYARFPSLTDSEKTAVNEFIYYAKNTLSGNGTTSVWDELDVIQLGEFSSSISPALANLKSSVFGNATIDNGSYAGQFSAGNGIQGSSANSFRIKTGYNPGDGARTYKYALNNACFGMATYSDTNGDQSDIWATTDPAGVGPFVAIRRDLATNNYHFRTDSVTALQCNAYSYCNFAKRYIVNGATLGHQTFLNGFLMVDLTRNGNHLQNSEFKRFAFYQGGSGWYSNRLQGHFWAGSGNLVPHVVEGLIYKYFTKLIGTSQSKQKNRMLFLGDGRVNGQNSSSIPQFSAFAEPARRTAEQLNGGAGNYTGGWTVSANGYGNRLVSNIITEMDTMVTPWVNTYLEKDYVIVDAVTSSVESNPAYLAVNGFSEIMTVLNTLRTAGFGRIIYVSPIDIQWTGWGGGQTQAGWNTFYADFIALMRAEFSIARTDINAFTFQNSNGIFMCQSQLISELSDANNTTYYNVNKAHLNQTGARVLSDTGIIPIIQAAS